MVIPAKKWINFIERMDSVSCLIVTEVKVKLLFHLSQKP